MGSIAISLCSWPQLESQGVSCKNIRISDRAHLLFDLHKEVDGKREEELQGGKIGTTKRGIGPAYATKANRIGLRVGDIRHWDSFCRKLRFLVEDAKKRRGGQADSDRPGWMTMTLIGLPRSLGPTCSHEA